MQRGIMGQGETRPLHGALAPGDFRDWWQVARQPSDSGRITTQVPSTLDMGGESGQGLHLPGVCQLLGTHQSTQRCHCPRI